MVPTNKGRGFGCMLIVGILEVCLWIAENTFNIQFLFTLLCFPIDPAIASKHIAAARARRRCESHKTGTDQSEYRIIQ